MSDGNFNRALLPSTPYRSGFKMGQQQTRKKAVDALHHALDQVELSLSSEQKEAIIRCFEKAL